jgi:hypothetical protein
LKQNIFKETVRRSNSYQSKSGQHEEKLKSLQTRKKQASVFVPRSSIKNIEEMNDQPDTTNAAENTDHDCAEDCNVSMFETDSDI